MTASTNSGRVAITGVGVVSPAGVGLQACHRALMAGASRVAELDPAWAASPFQLGAPVRQMAERDWIAPRLLRRMNRLSRMAVIAAKDALRHGRAEPDPRLGLVMGTGLGALDDTVELLAQLSRQDPAEVGPALFPSSVMNVAASQISICLGLQGYNTTVNHRELSAELALLVALEALRAGRAPRLLCGGVDELGRAVHHGYRRLGALGTGAPRPYRLGRDGICLGEGAAVLLLEPAAAARQRGARVLAEVAGIGFCGGERPLCGFGPAPERGAVRGPDVAAGVTAVQQALGEATCAPEDVDLVLGCGAGDPQLDRLEAAVLTQSLGDSPVLTSPHGTLGSWMAAGALRLACAVGMMQQSEIAPTITSGEPDPEVPVPGLVTAARPAMLDTVLVLGHAAGGAAGAVVLVREKT